MTPIPTIEFRRRLQKYEVDDHVNLLEAASREEDFIFGYVTRGTVDHWYLVTIHDTTKQKVNIHQPQINKIACYANKRSIMGRIG